MKLIAIVLLSLVIHGCNYINRYSDQVRGSGVMKSEKRTVALFSSIEASGAYDIKIVSQGEQSLELEGDDNILPLVSTEVRGDKLYIRSTKGFSSGRGIRVRISVPDIKGIESSGATSFEISNLKNDNFSIDSSGASTINVTGETKKVTIESSGASRINTEGLKAPVVTVTMSGAGSASVFASQELNATISGAGEITYAGDPATVNRKVSGVGSISEK